ncbi:hypothetical protein N7481_003534 [Penicillium waksmanii]|uniref:uncharacterized protein n=1 Tax=Penicillium waksmanii TaxID=69791 RepID=UPI002548CD92|nr:uncharacterized protein N7481_003534 [Penicillium waksmanii]KAJ5988324.1 hypothetical protein N7481_003534 [Penicillium waksmanii]
MVATFSPHRDSGGTLHLPSHSGIHHVDASSAIRQLRRSLSRSPSKSSNFFLNTRNQSPSKSTYISSSPISLSPFHSEQLCALPFICPAKRALAVSADSGNATPSQLIAPPPGEENDLTLDDLADPTDDSICTNFGISTTPAAPQSETPFAPRSTLSRIEKRRSGTFGSFATVSPLKRSDGIMNLDQASRGSPSAKRRSMHAPNFTDFSIFDNNCETAPPSPTEGESPSFPTPIQPFSPFATIPKRSSSLRRSTLQQRQGERPLFGKPRGPGDGDMSPGTPLAQPFLTTTPSQSSLLPPTITTLLLPSMSPLRPPRPTAHPLSRTITQSSSGSSLDDSPTHEPTHKSGPPRPIFNFSKSLPAGATRPAPVRRLTREDSGEFATPNNYKLVKPLPAAFMSTGLISKKNRNAEDPSGASFSKNMPDTPCKRPVNLFTAGPNPPPERLFDKSQSRLRESETVPESPFNPTPFVARSKPGPFAKGMGIFGNSFNRPEVSRRGSFVSIDGDEMQAESPSRPDSQPLTDSDFPPTPTKQTFLPSVTYPPSTSQFASLERLSEPNSSGHSTPLRERFLQATPQTPRDQYFPPDPSGLSISVPNDQSHPPDFGSSTNSNGLPATPTGPRESLLASKRPSLSLSGYQAPDVDPSLTARFEKVELVGTGEFSKVFRVGQPHDASVPSVFSLPSSDPKSPIDLPHQVWAVKKSKQPYSGLKDRERRIREVEVLKTMTNTDHVIHFVDSWEDFGHLYIQTEYCEEGSLDVFLAQAGLKARLDDFRIWKILLELSLGLKHIHDRGFIHLDLKPANILVTFEGVLKIADFGMAAHWPAQDGIDGEGDREYIGPEILMGRFDKPADIFSLGLIVFEIAGNVELPDNGVSWQKLRNGDMSDVPSLTWSSETSIFRDASGNPVSEESSFEDLCASDLGVDDFGDDFLTSRQLNAPKPSRLARSGELVDPPDFMINAHHAQALDKIVGWMISPEPRDRPTADQILETYGVQFVNQRRRAGATVFEGNFGPADEILAEDAEMIDV